MPKSLVNSQPRDGIELTRYCGAIGGWAVDKATRPSKRAKLGVQRLQIHWRRHGLPAAPSRRSWAFHVAIWFASVSNCCASSDSVLSALTVAKATLASNAGVSLWRARLVSFAPNSR